MVTDCGAGFERVLVEQDGEVVTINVSVEVVRDMRYVISSFLENHSMQASALPEGSSRPGFHLSMERRYW